VIRCLWISDFPYGLFTKRIESERKAQTAVMLNPINNPYQIPSAPISRFQKQENKTQGKDQAPVSDQGW